MSFEEGQSGVVGGIPWRIRKGRKMDGDLIVDLLAPDGWHPVKMSLVGLLTQFFYENEQRLYPPPRFRGGEFFVAFLRGCIRIGWSDASAMLEDQRRRRENAA